MFPDSIPWWFAFPTAFVASVSYLIIAIVQAPMDPNPEYSNWDARDGLPHSG